MGKRSGKKLKGEGQPINLPNVSAKAKERSLRKKMRARNIEVSSVPNIGPSSMSTMKINTSFAPSFVPTYDPIAVTTPLAFTFPTTSNRANGGINKEKESGESNSGFIFMCNGKTKPECYRCRVFGLPMGKLEVVKNIKLGTKLFLFDFDSKLLYGIYTATSNGELYLEPTAFDGKFPAQVRFNIFKDCLPLPESAFKHAIKDNYQGYKFRQELSGKQVNTLISLFRTITLPPPISAAPPFPNVGLPHTFPAQIMEEGFQPSKRLPPPPDESYSSGLHHSHTLAVRDTRTKQVVPCPLFNHNELETHVARVQSPVQPCQVVQQPEFPHHHLAEPHQPYHHLAEPHRPYHHQAESHQPYHHQAEPHQPYHHLAEPHQPYLPEKPFISPQDLYRRYGVVPVMVPGDQVRYGSEYQMSQLPRGGQIVPQQSEHVANYYRQHLPHTAAPHLSQVNALTPSYALQPSAQPQGILPSSFQPNYVAPINDQYQAYADPLQRTAQGSSTLLEAHICQSLH